MSGPPWRLTPNRFGRDLPGIENPAEPNTPPPYQRDNIKYETGEPTTTKINLLAWDADGDCIPDPSPFSTSKGWMFVDAGRMDENGDGVIEAEWAAVTDLGGTVFQAGDALPTAPILSAVTPNGITLSHEFFDTAICEKGGRQDAAKIFDTQVEIDYAGLETIGAVQEVTGLTNDAQVVTYHDDATSDSAVIFANTPTFNGSPPASVTFERVGESDMVLQLEEPNDLDVSISPKQSAC